MLKSYSFFYRRINYKNHIKTSHKTEEKETRESKSNHESDHIKDSANMKEKPVIINILRKQKPKENVERTQEKIKNVKQDKKKTKI